MTQVTTNINDTIDLAADKAKDLLSSIDYNSDIFEKDYCDYNLQYKTDDLLSYSVQDIRDSMLKAGIVSRKDILRICLIYQRLFLECQSIAMIDSIDNSEYNGLIESIKSKYDSEINAILSKYSGSMVAE